MGASRYLPLEGADKEPASSVMKLSRHVNGALLTANLALGTQTNFISSIRGEGQAKAMHHRQQNSCPYLQRPEKETVL